MKQLILVLLIGFTFSAFAQEKDGITYNNEGNEFVRNKDYKSAFESYKKALELYEAEGKIDTNLIYNAGYCAYKEKKYDEAKPYLEKAVEFNYKKSMPYIYLAQISSKSKDYEAMEKTLTAGLEKYPKDKNLNKLMGTCFFKQGYVFYKEGNSIKKNANSNGLNESDPDAFLAEYAKADAKFKESLPFFEQSYSFNPKSKNTLKVLENVYTSLKNEEAAAKIKTELETL